MSTQPDQTYSCTSVCPHAERLNALPPFETWGSMVKIIAEDESGEKEFAVHEGFMSHFSEYFKAAFNGPFLEGQTGIVRLEEAPKVVNAFLKWLYTREISMFQPETPTRQVTASSHSTFLIKLYLSGDVRLVPAFQDAVTDELIDHFAKYWTLPQIDISLVYGHTLNGSPLRKLSVDMVLYTVTDIGEYLKQHGAVYYTMLNVPEYAVELAISARERQPFQGNKRLKWCKINRCAYHQHCKAT